MYSVPYPFPDLLSGIFLRRNWKPKTNVDVVFGAIDGDHASLVRVATLKEDVAAGLVLLLKVFRQSFYNDVAFLSKRRIEVVVHPDCLVKLKKVALQTC